MSVHWGGRGSGHVSRWSASTSGVPSLVLDFLTTTSLDSRITFTRGSTATFTGSNGLIQNAAINVPRFDYDPVTLTPKGLLIEEQRTNLRTYSEQLDNAVYLKSQTTISPNVIAAPDGSITADKLVENTLNAVHTIEFYPPLTATTYAISFYAKQAGRSRIQLSGGGMAAQGITALFNLADGVMQSNVGNRATITSVGSGWYRCTFFITTTNNTTFTIIMTTDAGATTYLGDGTSGVYLWGIQAEIATFPTSYIPTVASQVTRSPDIATMTGTNFSSWYNQTQGAFVVSGDRFSAVNYSAFIAANDGTTTNEIYVTQAASQAEAYIRSAAGAAGDLVGPAWPANTVGRAALAYQLNNAGLSYNGSAVVSDTTVDIPTVTQLSIGNRNNLFLNGHIRQISYYNTRLLNTQLQTLSQ